jgi:hypothetical protein
LLSCSYNNQKDLTVIRRGSFASLRMTVPFMEVMGRSDGASRFSIKVVQFLRAKRHRFSPL